MIGSNRAEHEILAGEEEEKRERGRHQRRQSDSVRSAANTRVPATTAVTTATARMRAVIAGNYSTHITMSVRL